MVTAASAQRVDLMDRACPLLLLFVTVKELVGEAILCVSGREGDIRGKRKPGGKRGLGAGVGWMTKHQTWDPEGQQALLSSPFHAGQVPRGTRRSEGVVVWECQVVGGRHQGRGGWVGGWVK